MWAAVILNIPFQKKALDFVVFLIFCIYYFNLLVKSWVRFAHCTENKKYSEYLNTEVLSTLMSFAFLEQLLPLLPCDFAIAFFQWKSL